MDGWENFYMIVGSSAAALTGLMFVVISLTAEVRASGEEAVNAFSRTGSGTRSSRSLRTREWQSVR